MENFVKALSITQLIPKNKLKELSNNWQIDKGVIKFKTRKLLDVLMWSFVFEKKTLRDVTISYGIPKSTLDDALAKRSYGFFEDLNRLALKEVIAHIGSRKERQDFRELLALDSSVCNIHGAVAEQFISTRMNKKQAGVKLHAIWNITYQWIEDFKITGFRRNDGAVGHEFEFSRGKTYVFDRAYVDFALWLKIEAAGAHFVTRLKKLGNRLSYIHKANVDLDECGVLYDGKWKISDSIRYKRGIRLKNKCYRHIIYRDPESKKLFDFVTSDFEIEAIEVANNYRKRWAVELLFRWLKGHLNIRRFAFKNMNAIKVLLSTVVLLQLLLKARMVKECFKGSAWDYLRLKRNKVDRDIFEIITHGGFYSKATAKPPPKWSSGG